MGTRAEFSLTDVYLNMGTQGGWRENTHSHIIDLASPCFSPTDFELLEWVWRGALRKRAMMYSEGCTVYLFFFSSSFLILLVHDLKTTLMCASIS